MTSTESRLALHFLSTEHRYIVAVIMCLLVRDVLTSYKLVFAKPDNFDTINEFSMTCELEMELADELPGSEWNQRHFYNSTFGNVRVGRVRGLIFPKVEHHLGGPLCKRIVRIYYWWSSAYKKVIPRFHGKHLLLRLSTFILWCHTCPPFVVRNDMNVIYSSEIDGKFKLCRVLQKVESNCRADVGGSRSTDLASSLVYWKLKWIEFQSTKLDATSVEITVF